MYYFYNEDEQESGQPPRFTQSLAFPFLFAIIVPLILVALGFFLPAEIGLYVLLCAAPPSFLFGAGWFAVCAWRAIS